MHDILNELDLSYNGRLELSDYLQVKAMDSCRQIWRKTVVLTRILKLCALLVFIKLERTLFWGFTLCTLDQSHYLVQVSRCISKCIVSCLTQKNSKKKKLHFNLCEQSNLNLWFVFAYYLQSFGDEKMENVTGEELHEILREIDTNMNGQVELDEYLQVCVVKYI